MLYCTLIWLEDLAFVNSKKRKKIEIKYLLRLLRRTFLSRVLPPPVSHLLVFALCFLGYLILRSCCTDQPLACVPSTAPWARSPRDKAIGCRRRYKAKGLLCCCHQNCCFWCSFWWFLIFLSFLTRRIPVDGSVGLYDPAWHPKIYLTLERCVPARSIVRICIALLKFSACMQSESLNLSFPKFPFL